MKTKAYCLLLYCTHYLTAQFRYLCQLGTRGTFTNVLMLSIADVVDWHSEVYTSTVRIYVAAYEIDSNRTKPTSYATTTTALAVLDTYTQSMERHRKESEAKRENEMDCKENRFIYTQLSYH